MLAAALTLTCVQTQIIFSSPKINIFSSPHLLTSWVRWPAPCSCTQTCREWPSAGICSEPPPGQSLHNNVFKYKYIMRKLGRNVSRRVHISIIIQPIDIFKNPILSFSFRLNEPPRSVQYVGNCGQTPEAGHCFGLEWDNETVRPLCEPCYC